MNDNGRIDGVSSVRRQQNPILNYFDEYAKMNAGRSSKKGNKLNIFPWANQNHVSQVSNNIFAGGANKTVDTTSGLN